MGSNIVWFDSLTKQRQYDLLFEWEQEKWKKRFITKPTTQKKPELKIINRRYKRVMVDVIVYPDNLKYFIREVKSSRRSRYKVNVDRVRNAAIDILLKNN